MCQRRGPENGCGPVGEGLERRASAVEEHAKGIKATGVVAVMAGTVPVGATGYWVSKESQQLLGGCTDYPIARSQAFVPAP